MKITNIMIKKLIFSIVLVLLGLGSCDNVIQNKGVSDNFIELNIDSTLTKYPKDNENVLEIKINGVNERIEVFDTSGVLKRIQLYTNSVLDTMLTFYENGDIYSINTFWLDNKNVVDNTWIYFTSTGDTLEEKSYYYLMSGTKDHYSLNEKATIFLKINRPKYGDSLFVSNCKEVLIREKEIKTSLNSMVLQIPTDILGINKLEFTINDCLIESDTSLYCKPIMGVFKYEVIE